MMQEVEVTSREKKKISSPVMMAPMKLVAAKVMPRSITDVKIVPRAPVRKSPDLAQRQRLRSQQGAVRVDAKVTAR